MSLLPPSRKPDDTSHQPSLADVREMIVADEGLSLRRRQDVSSALRTVAKALGRRLEEMPAHPGYLRERLERFTPAMAGLSARRWRNALSLTRSALKLAGLAHLPGRYQEPLMPAWAELFGHLNDTRMRLGLSRLTRWCGVRGIAPDQVNDEVLSSFLVELCDAGTRQAAPHHSSDRLHSVEQGGRRNPVLAQAPLDGSSLSPGLCQAMEHVSAFP